MKSALLVVCLLPTLCAAQESLRVGRLFDPASKPESAIAEAIVTNNVKVNGVVVRSSGLNTVWLNDQALKTSAQLPYSLAVKRNTLPEIGINQHLARIGDRIDIKSGENTESIRLHTSASKR